MILENLDLEQSHWCKEFLNFENGLIELTIWRSGKYEIIQQSRSTKNYRELAMGVTVQLEIELAKVCPLTYGEAESYAITYGRHR